MCVSGVLIGVLTQEISCAVGSTLTGGYGLLHPCMSLETLSPHPIWIVCMDGGLVAAILPSA